MTARQKKLNERDAKAQELKKINDEFEALVKAQEDERDATKKKIEELCEGKYFCGVILTEQNILAITNQKFGTKENIKIGFQLYIDEPEIDDDLNTI